MAIPVQRALWFENSLARFLMVKDQESGRNNGIVRGSSIGTECLRALAYMVLGYDKAPEPAHDCYVLNFGNAFHDMIQGWVVEMGFVKATPYLRNGQMQWKGDAEQSILDAQMGVHGHFDGLTQPLSIEGKDLPIGIVAERDGKRYLLEFKTISNRSRVHLVYIEDWNGDYYVVKYLLEPGVSLLDTDHIERLQGSPPKRLGARGTELYEEMVDNGLRPPALVDVIHKVGKFQDLTRPKDEHIAQATFYASKLHADGILIVYLAKDANESSYPDQAIWNLPIKAFELSVDKEQIKQLQNKMEYFWENLERRSLETENVEDWLPERDFDIDQLFSPCNLCSYKHICYKDHPDVQAENHRITKQRALMQLPIIGTEPFQRHSKEEWGREAARQGKIADHHERDTTE